MLLGLAFLGTYWFWAVLATFVTAFCFVVGDKGILAAVPFILLGVVLWFLPDTEGGLDWVIANRTFFYYAGAVYFPIGLGWGIFKWWIFAHDKKAELLEKLSDWKQDFLRDKRNKEAYLTKVQNEVGDLAEGNLNTAIHNLDRFKWENFYQDKLDRYNFPPKIIDHKADFIRWLSWWPFSVTQFVCADFLRRIAQQIYNVCAIRLQGVSDKVFRDLKMPPKID